jgi:hypothetical protein
MKKARLTARIHLLCATARPVVIVIRRKPTCAFHVLRWNTRDDALEAGSWFFGRLYEKRCDVSPDGEWLVYFAATQNRQGGHSWTGLAHPPWLKTVAHGEGTGTWLGGGFWRDAGTLCVTAYPGWAAPELKADKPPRVPFAVERHDWRRDAGDLEVLTHRFDRDWQADESASAPRTTVAKGGNWSVRGVTWTWTRKPSRKHPALSVRDPSIPTRASCLRSTGIRRCSRMPTGPTTTRSASSFSRVPACSTAARSKTCARDGSRSRSTSKGCARPSAHRGMLPRYSPRGQTNREGADGRAGARD